MSAVWDFRERLNFSNGTTVSQPAIQHMVQMIPGAISVCRADVNDDRHGTDYWIKREHGLPPISVDVKHRQFDPVERFGSDDACIETTSVYTGPRDGTYKQEFRRRPGWTVDYRKRTDLLMYTWPCGGGQRFWVLYFPHLCAAARSCWREWAAKYRERVTLNDGYVTLCVYPPRRVIAEAMRKIVQGKVEA